MTQRPNILFIFSDQQHWQAVGFEDASFQTPALDRLASEGTVFRHAFCTTPQCSPSRSSMLTGLYPTKTGVQGNMGAAGAKPLPMRTIGAMLQEAGYRTAYFGKWHLGKDPVGTAGWSEDVGVTGAETTDDKEVTRHALECLHDAREGDKPFALFLSYNNPHDIYHFSRESDPTPVQPVDLPITWHRKDLTTVPSVQRQFMTEDQGKVIVNAEAHAWARYREIYREKVKLYDDEVGQVLAALDDHVLSDTTLVVATSDHGDMDGQHRLIYKGPFMYEHMMRVPLIVRPPRSTRKPNASSDFYTVNVDLVPTLADFAGVAIPRTDGMSLKPIIDGKQSITQRTFVVGQYYSKQRWVNPIRMIRTERYKYNNYREHGEELYDLVHDPHELENLACDTKHREAKEALQSLLDQWLSANGDPFYSLAPTTRDGKPVA